MKSNSINETLKSAAALLAGLGATAAEVAASRKSQRASGVRGSEGECPVAVYLDRSLGESMWTSYPGFLTARGESLEMPAPVAAFVAGFDAGKFPGLDA